MNAVELFHFLRPLWLFALPLVALTWWTVRRRGARAWPISSPRTFATP